MADCSDIKCFEPHPKVFYKDLVDVDTMSKKDLRSYVKSLKSRLEEYDDSIAVAKKDFAKKEGEAYDNLTYARNAYVLMNLLADCPERDAVLSVWEEFAASNKVVEDTGSVIATKPNKDNTLTIGFDTIGSEVVVNLMKVKYEDKTDIGYYFLPFWKSQTTQTRDIVVVDSISYRTKVNKDGQD